VLFDVMGADESVGSESETPENNAISEAADADTFDIAVGTKAAITVKIKIFLIIIRTYFYLIVW
jgi:hypothetical protein